MTKSENIGNVVIVMVPFPAQGHLNQLLNLSRLLAAYNLPIHYVGTTTHVRQAKLRLHGWDPLSSSNITFHELETPPFSSPPPNPTDPMGFPSHLLPAFTATSHLREPVGSLLCDMSSGDDSPRRVVVIHDSLMVSVVQDVVTVPNAESYSFESVSAFCIFRFVMEFTGKNYAVDNELSEEVPSFYDCITLKFLEFSASLEPYRHFNSGKLYNTSRVIEGNYIDMLINEEVDKNVQHWAIGPFNPLTFNKNSQTNRHICLDWLDRQDSNSVIFVSFGTTTSLTDEQINELALGLEMSDQKFIWVLRDADKGDVFDENVRKPSLPKEYESRIEGRGIVVRDWAPQLEILAHTATGGFMSHCGWNSCMESISCGVPVATWPMHSDQPNNAVLVTKVLKIGVVVRDWARRNELVTSSMVEKGVRRLMGEIEGDEMRKRASELADKVKIAASEGGTSKTELDSFVAHITR